MNVLRIKTNYFYLKAISFKVLQRPLDGLFPLLIQNEISVCDLQLARGQFGAHLNIETYTFVLTQGD